MTVYILNSDTPFRLPTHWQLNFTPFMQEEIRLFSEETVPRDFLNISASKSPLPQPKAGQIR